MVFVVGALGDGIVMWPVYRAMCRRGWTVEVVGEREKVKLAEREVNRSLAGCVAGGRPGRVVAVDGDSAATRELWTGSCATACVRQDVALAVYTFEHEVWCRGAGAMLPRAEVLVHAEPGYRPGSRLWERFEVESLGGVEAARPDAAGPVRVVMHLGAGSRVKRWPVERFEELARLLVERGAGERRVEVVPIYGEVEAEQFGAGQWAALGRMHAMTGVRRWDGHHRHGGERAGHAAVETLGQLAEVIRGAAVFVGCDTGPTHLAAQLGVATVGLYSAEQEEAWLARGPRVRIVRAGGGGAGVATIEAERVLGEILGLLATG
jgi:hypothetical protein